VFGLLGLALATVPLRYLFGIGDSGKAKTAGAKR
jgi:hypothetical protein